MIEAAIVLGIVAVTLGGLWYAASVVQENIKINDTSKGMIAAANTLKQLVTPATAAPDGNGWTDIKSLCVNTRAFTGFIIDSSGRIQNPFNSVYGSIYGSVAGWGGYCGILNSNISIVAVVLPTTSICQRLIAKITSYYKDTTDLAFVWISGDDNVIRSRNTYPLSPTGTDCAGLVTPIKISLFYNFALN